MTTLEAIDARLARYRALVAELESLRREVVAAAPAVETRDGPVLLPIPPQVVPVGNGPRAAAVKKPGPKPTAPAGGRDEATRQRRLTLARILAATPLGPRQLSEKAGIPKGSICGLLDHPWFTKSGSHLLSPYTLTEAGRAALAEYQQKSNAPTA